jgi:hypothetical protein
MEKLRRNSIDVSLAADPERDERTRPRPLGDAGSDQREVVVVADAVHGRDPAEHLQRAAAGRCGGTHRDSPTSSPRMYGAQSCSERTPTSRRAGTRCPAPPRQALHGGDARDVAGHGGAADLVAVQAGVPAGRGAVRGVDHQVDVAVEDPRDDPERRRLAWPPSAVGSCSAGSSDSLRITSASTPLRRRTSAVPLVARTENPSRPAA